MKLDTEMPDAIHFRRRSDGKTVIAWPAKLHFDLLRRTGQYEGPTDFLPEEEQDVGRSKIIISSVAVTEDGMMVFDPEDRWRGCLPVGRFDQEYEEITREETDRQIAPKE